MTLLREAEKDTAYFPFPTPALSVSGSRGLSRIRYRKLSGLQPPPRINYSIVKD
jgi:hypothetical protein